MYIHVRACVCTHTDVSKLKNDAQRREADDDDYWQPSGRRTYRYPYICTHNA